MRLLKCVLFFLLACCVSVYADDFSGKRTFRKSYRLFYRVDKSVIDSSYKGNAEVIEKMKGEIDSLMAAGVTVDSVIISSTASPEGNENYNKWLSQRRGRTAEGLVFSIWPGMRTSVVVPHWLGEDWDVFWEILKMDRDIPQRDLIAQVRDSISDNDEREKRLRELRTGFFYILRNHAYLMRAADVSFVFALPSVEVPPVIPPVMPQTPVAGQSGNLVRKSSETIQDRPSVMPEKKMILAARTNLLVPALNVGLEVPIKYNWSVGVDYYFPWWLSANNKYCIEMLGLFVDGKYWFGRNRAEEDKLTGHAIGLYAGAGYYDFQWMRSGYQGEYLDFGVDYTYAIPVAKGKLRMEFNVGLGWIHTVARHYTPDDAWSDLIKDPGIKHRKYNFFGPTRASVSFIVPIRAKFNKKGGRK